MPRRDIDDVGNELSALFTKNSYIQEYPTTHIMKVIARLVHSIYKSADDPNRGDFAKGREQMAMHAIALLVGAKNWKQVERILFGEETAAVVVLDDDFNVEDSNGR